MKKINSFSLRQNMDFEFYPKASRLKMTFLFTFILNKKNPQEIKTNHKILSVTECIFLLHSQKWLRMSRLLVFLMKTLISMVQGNPSKEEIDSTLRNSECHYANRKTFSKGKISNRSGRKIFPEQLWSLHKRKMCFLRRNNKVHMIIQGGSGRLVLCFIVWA